MRSVFSVKTVRNLVKSMLLRNAFVMLWAKPVSGNPKKGFAKRSRRRGEETLTKFAKKTLMKFVK